jgi:choline dehydrogenase
MQPVAVVSLMHMRESYDYVVVGAGSSGCVVAARLAEERAGNVLLLEAGNAAEKNPATMSADGFVESFANDNVMLDRLSEPQTACGERRFYVGSGRGMGGSGAVNGMVYTRGDKLDFAAWPAGWQWDDVLPSFEALEARLRVQTKAPTPFLDLCAEAAVQAGFRRKDKLHDGELCGFMGYQMMNFDGDRRRSTYMAFIHGVRHDDLTVQSDALVQRIVFDGQRAVAVQYEQGGRQHTVEVSKEVILCAGACETPKLLMLSGVGERQQLSQLGIREVLDSPMVGKHMQDHLTVAMFYRGSKLPDNFYPQLYGFERVNRELPLARGQADTCYLFFTPMALGQTMKRMIPAEWPPSLFRNKLLRKGLSRLIDAALMVPQLRTFVAETFGMIVILGKPQSRGEVRLASTDARVQALIDPRYLSDPRDLETLVDGVLKAQQIAKQASLATWGNKALSSIAKTTDREQIKKGIVRGMATTFHYAGTCRLGEGDDAPVDLSLRVKGLENVRVADASIIPEIPVSALNAPSMMIGYRAAQLILDELKSASTERDAAAAGVQADLP